MIMHSPLEQFEIFKLGPRLLGLTFSNFSITLGLIVLSITLSFHLFTRETRIIPTRWQSFVESLYSYLLLLLVENAGKRSQVYFPFVFVVFMFVLGGNVFGMFPLGYTVTSQVLVTFLLSSTVFLGSIFIGLWKHNVNFFSLFFPSGSPKSLSFLLVPIELISFISKPFSLGIRLFANMLAGHVLLKIIAGFIFSGIWFANVTSFIGVEMATLFQTLNKNILSFLMYTNSPPTEVSFKAVSVPGFPMSCQTVVQPTDPSETRSECFFCVIPLWEDFHKIKLDPDKILAGWKTMFSAKEAWTVNFYIFHSLGLLLFPIQLLIKMSVTLIPLLLLNAFILLEIGIVFLQAYVFVILTSIYIGDAVNLH